MILAQVTNEVFNTGTWLAQGVHHFIPQLSLEGVTQVVAGLLAVSKLAQIAFKHWTTTGTKLDTLMKTIGVVQEPTVNTVVTNTVNASTEVPAPVVGQPLIK